MGRCSTQCGHYAIRRIPAGTMFFLFDALRLNREKYQTDQEARALVATYSCHRLICSGGGGGRAGEILGYSKRKKKAKAGPFGFDGHAP
ncbi:uncharacterized protein VTP21DRAFT_1176 [Calcarisporiella thermophila]|uniref:uncharacterized protein n=1 Tax=Calcarisporiella thermophila TaxID=911321 RepID=UPI00374265C9